MTCSYSLCLVTLPLTKFSVLVLSIIHSTSLPLLIFLFLPASLCLFFNFFSNFTQIPQLPVLPFYSLSLYSKWAALHSLDSSVFTPCYFEWMLLVSPVCVYVYIQTREKRKGLKEMNSSLTFLMTELQTTQSHLPNDSRTMHCQALVCVCPHPLNNSLRKDREIEAKRRENRKHIWACCCH